MRVVQSYRCVWRLSSPFQLEDFVTFRSAGESVSRLRPCPEVLRCQFLSERLSIVYACRRDYPTLKIHGFAQRFGFNDCVPHSPYSLHERDAGCCKLSITVKLAFTYRQGQHPKLQQSCHPAQRRSTSSDVRITCFSALPSHQLCPLDEK